MIALKKLLAIFAHPDDEGAIAGTLAHYANQGIEVSLICATKGEEGEISDPALATHETIGDVRTAELETACEIIGIKQLHFLGYRDSGMINTPPNEDPRSLVQAEPEEAIGKLVAFMRQLQPDIVITFEPYGWYGHPDHRAVYRLAAAAYARVGDASIHPAAGQLWQPQRLFYAVLPVSKFQIMAAYARANNLPSMGEFKPQEIQLASEAQITHTIDVREFLETKQSAMHAHQTQFGEDHLFRRLPPEIVQQLWSEEHFILVDPTHAEHLTVQQATDLFVD